MARRDDPIALSGWPQPRNITVIPGLTYVNSGAQPSADNRTGCVVDLASNIYELF